MFLLLFLLLLFFVLFCLFVCLFVVLLLLLLCFFVCVLLLLLLLFLFCFWGGGLTSVCHAYVVESIIIAAFNSISYAVRTRQYTTVSALQSA